MKMSHALRTVFRMLLAIAVTAWIAFTVAEKKLAALREQVAALQGTSGDLALARDEEARKTSAEIARLRQENAELHRLRNEVRALRSETERLRAATNRLARVDKPTEPGGRRAPTADEIFLAEHSRQPGVVTLPSGLQYTILEQGSGAIPGSNSLVTVHYRGTRVDGTEVDNSHARGQPAQFPVNGVVKGWTEALQLMPAGSKWQIVLPPDLAYGEKGAGEKIPANSALIFEIELIGVK